MRNRRREREAAAAGITEEERIAQGKLNGELDKTDFENQHVSSTSLKAEPYKLTIATVPLHPIDSVHYYVPAAMFRLVCMYDF